MSMLNILVSMYYVLYCNFLDSMEDLYYGIEQYNTKKNNKKNNTLLIISIVYTPLNMKSNDYHKTLKICQRCNFFGLDFIIKRISPLFTDCSTLSLISGVILLQVTLYAPFFWIVRNGALTR